MVAILPNIKCNVVRRTHSRVLDDSADSADSEEEDEDEDFTVDTAEVDINARDRWRLTPIYAAIWGASFKSETPDKQGARLDIRVEKSSLLHFVCAMGPKTMSIFRSFESIARCGCKILLSDELGRSPLHIAAMMGYECVDLFFQVRPARLLKKICHKNICNAYR